MKLFHLADLHIGKKVNGYSMIDDQRFVLDQVIARIRAEQPDALILAGDIYDRRNPPVEAVALFDAFVSQVVLELDVPVLAIGGNHDGGERLGFANAIQAKAGLHLAGAFSWPLPKVRLTDADGPVDVYLMAYADLAVLHQLVPETEGMDYAQAMDHVLSQTALDPAARNVLVAHGVVTGDEALATCDSERTLSIGGTEFWQSASLAAFDYVALGHLHQAQRAGSDRIRYAGSLLQYSFSEENQQKVMLSVQLSADGALQIEALPLNPLRRLDRARHAGKSAHSAAGIVHPSRRLSARCSRGRRQFARADAAAEKLLSVHHAPGARIRAFHAHRPGAAAGAADRKKTHAAGNVHRLL